MHILLTTAKVVLGAALTRLALKRATRGIAARAQAVEADAEQVLEVAEEVEGDPEDVAAEHTEEGMTKYGGMQRTATGQRRFVGILVMVARAEFGAPLPEQQRGLQRDAAYLKVRAHLIKWCKDHNVRTKDIANNVDDATALWFVPTRRDVRRALIMGSAHVANRYMEEREAHSRPFGVMLRTLLRLAGHDLEAKKAGRHQSVLPTPQRQ